MSSTMLPGWSRVSIAGKPVDVFDPPGEGIAFQLLYLHPVGLESLAENATWTAELTRRRIGCCVPSGMRSWWTDRICPEFDSALSAESHLLENVVPWMAERWGSGANRLAVAGISMGGQGALRLGFKYPDRFPVVAGVASALEYEQWYGQGSPIDDMYRSREACRQDTAGLHIQPNKYPPHIWFACDPADVEWHRGNDRLDEKLRALGIAHEADLETTNGGHCWPYFDGMAPKLFDWLDVVMKKQARRLM